MKTYIWTIPTRLFHWLLAISFTVAFLLGGEARYLNLHAALGSLIGVLILFRIIQGFIGPKYARFGDFPVSLSALKTFVTNMKVSKASHPGHNPLAAVIMLAMIGSALLSSLSGMLILASGDAGFLGIRITPAFDAGLFGEIHEVVVHLFLILVGVHLTGILADMLFHPQSRTIRSIFTGYKQIRAVPVTPNPFRRWFSVIWFVLPLVLFFYILKYQPVPAGDREEPEQGIESNEAED